jgi:hypothetical protein
MAKPRRPSFTQIVKTKFLTLSFKVKISIHNGEVCEVQIKLHKRKIITNFCIIKTIRASLGRRGFATITIVNTDKDGDDDNDNDDSENNKDVITTISLNNNNNNNNFI